MLSEEDRVDREHERSRRGGNPAARLAAGGRALVIPVYLRAGSGSALCIPIGDVGERLKPAPC